MPADSDFGGTALQVDVLQQGFDDALAGLIDTRFAQTETRERVTLAGNEAFRLELVATGEGLEERGTRTFGYLIRRAAGPPVLVKTTARPGESIRYRDVVDHAAQTIRFFPPAEAAPAASTFGLPGPVAEQHAELLAAAQSGDPDRVAALADTDFRYTFGGPVEGGPAAYWRQIEDEQHPLEALAAILQLPYTLSRGIYYWPFAYDKTADEITQHEALLLQRLPPGTPNTVGPEGYLGWRAGITPDGRWIFFVAGD